jgi:hypothetical protein
LIFSRAGEVREESLKNSLEELRQALEVKTKDVERLHEQKNAKIKALKTDLVYFGFCCCCCKRHTSHKLFIMLRFNI